MNNIITLESYIRNILVISVARDSPTNYFMNDLKSLRQLFADLNFDFSDAPVNQSTWSDSEKSAIADARIIAHKHSYKIYYLKTNSTSFKYLKTAASKIIKSNRGFCLVCSHNSDSFKWIFSLLSKTFSKSFNETRHLPIELRPHTNFSKPFIEFLDKIIIPEQSTSLSIFTTMSDAFDEFAIQIHDELTSNVFDALKILTIGIINNKKNHLPLTEASLSALREPTFIFLYRIMFTLYAEDREIFPVENPTYYKKYSMKYTKLDWLLKHSGKDLPEGAALSRLNSLFKLIANGSTDLGYDQNVLHMRSYFGRLFARDLYPLLEKWHISNEVLLKVIDLLTRTKDKHGNSFFLNYAGLETRHLGSIYERMLEYRLIINDNTIISLSDVQERKSHGSYYTPKLIVDYIVKQTIEPAIQTILQSTSIKESQIDKILSLKVLDPSMGSGHFLVGATNYLAGRICEIENNHDEYHYIDRKRDVVRRCIYGVDINPLAVDLAMVTLWLETLSVTKPLSFLSTHLKCGNSLVGSSFDILFDKQTTLAEFTKNQEYFKKCVRDFLAFETWEDDDSEIVRAKVSKYQKMRIAGTLWHDFKFLLDCKTAESFGVTIRDFGDYRAKIGEGSLCYSMSPAAEKARKLSQTHGFFHWELEFPALFYNLKGKRKKSCGFNIVIGNPPYGAKVTPDISKYLQARYNVGRDTAQCMIRLASNIIVEDGYNSFVVPKALTFANNWSEVRSLIRNRLKLLVDVGQLWHDVKLEQVIYVIHNKDSHTYMTGFKRNNALIVKTKIDIDQSSIFKILITAINNKELKLGLKIHSKCNMLNNFIDNSRGGTLQKKIQTHGDYPVLHGAQIQRYSINDDVQDYINKDDISTNNAYIESDSILVQNVIAHIKTPVDHIRIDASLPQKTNFIILDSINQLKINKSVNPHYILGLLNSKIINWYTYRFIFAKAIRTIKIDNPTTSKIPVTINNVNPIVNHVKKILDLNNELNKIYCKIQMLCQKHNYDICLTKLKALEVQKIYTLNQHFDTFVNVSLIETKLKKYANDIINIKYQILKINNELNHKFYNIYGLTASEINMIESSMPDF